MLLFQYDSHTILFVSVLTVSHFISSINATYFLPLSGGFLHPQFVYLSSLHKVCHSLPLPVMVPTFNVATPSLIFLSSFLSFFLLHCFPSLLCIQVACPPVALGAPSLVTAVVIPGLYQSSIKSDTTRIENIWLGFMPDALPVATLPICLGFGLAPRLLKFEQPWRLG